MPSVTWPATELELADAGYSFAPGFSRCRSCRASVRWARTPAGKALMCERVGDDRWQAHFASCPDAHKWRRRNGKGR